MDWQKESVSVFDDVWSVEINYCNNNNNNIQ